MGRRAEEEAGRVLDGQTYDEMPERIDPVVPSKADRLAAITEVESLISSTC